MPRILYFLSFLLSVLLILIFYSQQQGWNLNYLFNSDILYFPSLYKDLFIDQYRPEGWYIPGSPGFFPDMALYFIIMGLAGPTVISSCLYSIVQFLLIMLLFNTLIRIVLPTGNLYMLTLVNSLFGLLVLAGVYGDSYLITFHVLSNTYHLGAFVNALIALIFSFCYLRYRKDLYFFLLLITILLAVLSDRLFLILYTVPFLLALVPWLRRENLALTLKFFGANILVPLLGIIILRLIRLYSGIHLHQLYSDISMQKMLSSFQVLMQQMKGYILKWNLFSFVLIGSLIFTTGLLIFLIAVRREYIKSSAISGQRSLHLVFLIFSLLFMLVVFWAPVLLGDYPSGAKIRYIIFVFYYAMLVAVPILSIIWRPGPALNKLPVYASVTLVTVLIFLAGIKCTDRDFSRGLKTYFGFYPDVARCMDAMKEKYPLKHGVSLYWQAKGGTLFSREDVRLYTVYDANLVPYKHVCNENWYYPTGYGKYDPPVFNFIIFPEDEPLDPLYKSMGEPIAREVWGDYVFLLVRDFVYSRSNPFPILKDQ